MVSINFCDNNSRILLGADFEILILTVSPLMYMPPSIKSNNTSDNISNSDCNLLAYCFTAFD